MISYGICITERTARQWGALRQTTLGCPSKRKRDGQGYTRGTIPTKY